MSARRRALIATGVVLASAVAFGLYWFAPWKLWTNHRVNDVLPAVATAPLPAPTAHASAASTVRRATLLARGKFISQEHGTSGTASIVRLASGRRVLAIANLHTSEGPVVKVWLTDQHVTDDTGWHVFDDGRHVDLGSLRGNLGNQLYPIPDDADLTGLRSVSIWCDRFDVSFGAAELIPVS
jgi:hypothetical protein